MAIEIGPLNHAILFYFDPTDNNFLKAFGKAHAQFKARTGEFPTRGYAHRDWVGADKDRSWIEILGVEIVLPDEYEIRRGHILLGR